MGVYSSRDILELAMQLEDAGRLFYDVIADECPHERLAKLCRKLAWYEEVHFQQFMAIRDRLAPEPRASRLGAAEMQWLHRFTGREVIPGRQAAKELARSASPLAILDRAVQTECEAIDFYTRVKSVVGPEDTPAVEKIIDEERKHLRAIEAARERFRDGTWGSHSLETATE